MGEIRLNAKNVIIVITIILRIIHSQYGEIADLCNLLLYDLSLVYHNAKVNQELSLLNCKYCSFKQVFHANFDIKVYCKYCYNPNRQIKA